MQDVPITPIRCGISPNAIRVKADTELTGIMIATPCYGGMVNAPFMHGILDTHVMCMERKVPLSFATLHSESLVQRARNHLVGHFLASRASHMMFIDADIGFTAASILRLVAHNKDIVGAPYRKKDRTKVDWAINLHGQDSGKLVMEPTGIFRVKHLATGFMMIHRRVLEALYDGHPEWHYKLAPNEGEPGGWREKLASIFDCFRYPDTEDGMYLSEDWGFCHRAEAEGFQIWCDPGIILQHYGVTDFGADPTVDFYPQREGVTREVELA
jgi:hypothetical protein